MFHWAFHAWAIYAVSALAIAYTAYARDKPLLPSVPFIGVSPGIRRAMDWVALLAVTFGVVASIGQGAINMGAGATKILDTNSANTVFAQILIILGLFVVYIGSAWRGLKGGIEPLSNFNMVLGIVLIGFVFLAGPTIKLVGDIVSMATAYGAQFFTLSTDLRPEGEPRDWTRAWSLTYFHVVGRLDAVCRCIHCPDQ